MSDRDAILGGIRQSLEVNRAMLEREAADHGYGESHPAGPFMPADLTPVAQFTAELEALHGHVHLCAGPREALEKVRSLLVSHEVESVLHWDWQEIPLPGIGHVVQELGIQSATGQLLGAPDRSTRLQALDPVPICISGADAGIAESGTLVVMSGPGRGRLASLLPPIHLAILPADHIVRTLPNAFALLEAEWGSDVVRDRSNITLITGPSRTADIEQSLTLGVHGPKEIHVVIVGADTGVFDG